MEDERHLPFRYSVGPLVRASLLNCSASRHLIVIGMSCLCADAQSLKILTDEAVRYYLHELGSPALPNDELIQYAQYSGWQEELLADSDAKDGAAYWRAVQLGAVYSGLPFEQQVQLEEFTPESVSQEVLPETLAQVDSIACATNTSRSTACSAAG